MPKDFATEITEDTELEERDGLMEAIVDTAMAETSFIEQKHDSKSAYCSTPVIRVVNVIKRISL